MLRSTVDRQPDQEWKPHPPSNFHENIKCGICRTILGTAFQPATKHATQHAIGNAVACDRYFSSSSHLTIGIVLASTPNGTYAPGYVQCPANMTWIREASTGLSPNETAWLNLRRPNVINQLESWLPRALSNVANNTFNVSAYISALRSNQTQTPILAIGLSGGGARATLSGYGAWQALDERWPAANASGIGGLAQALTYYAGLSGGGVPIGGVAMSNFSTVQQLLSYGSYLGNISSSALGYYNTTVEGDLIGSYIQQIASKAEQGFNVTITDFFGFVAAPMFLFEGSYPGNQVPLVGRTWSDIQNYPAFAQGLYPMPMIVTSEVVTPGIPNVTTSYGVLYPAPNSTNVSIDAIVFPNIFTR
jgi:lysophospholipase